ncbi:biosynthetic arginine decarboxylase [Desulfovibrio litoralis]|uniref:Biosynthetic arginine decarboxylase n=1 Tax=Desulfovibrio litoralis DSM 11393 TaxID=1121455 RepID=A0A1M7RWY6_9BACT|nr:biosynthetic arginine decarboxylase [Desulfovibrio litoralis]SHN50809.1 arginine decarboxylase [Desulfovibrio litoralis DSM 11393]
MAKKRTLQSWSVEDSANLYGIREWGADYFDVAPNGDVTVRPIKNKRNINVSIPEIIEGMRERGLGMPVLLRIENILDSQISRLHEAFAKAIKTLGYRGSYRGVFPIKVNQQQQVVEKIAQYGARYHHGLEVGSKAELLAAISQLRDLEACLVCNGYKDEEFIDLGLHARRMGFKCFFVVEMPRELSLILERAKALGVKPLIGVRAKLASKAGGHWTESGGERSTFGLTAAQIIDVVDELRRHDMLDCFQLLHYHLGSQLSNIREIRAAALEASRVYAGLVQEGVTMGYLDLGGGLAVDYDGSRTNFLSSRNYSIDEYCMDVLEAVMSILDETNVPHPNIITESGRATVAYYSLLIFNILDVSRIEYGDEHDIYLDKEALSQEYEIIRNLYEVLTNITIRNLQECYNDAIYYRDEMRQHFLHGKVTLRQRTKAERLFWVIIKRIATERNKMPNPHKNLAEIDNALADIYYGNFSVFQSLPDSWAINQLFPIMPLHRLNEVPTRQAIISDITCDSDGRIDRFIAPHGMKNTLDLHDLKEGEEYYLGVFLVGAYQETLGDLHNLLGDTNVVSVRVDEDGGFEFVREIHGDSVSDILSYVEYDPRRIMEDLRALAEESVRAGRITPSDRYNILQAFEAGIRGYTYFER